MVGVASCPGNRRVIFAINGRLEYFVLGGASCPGNRRVKCYINGRLEYV